MSINPIKHSKSIMTSTNQQQQLTNVPTHVAIIMDGNGRWAKARGLDRCEGHIEGVNTVRRITEAASEFGVKFLTLYTFSTENWNRPKAEVDALMTLLGVAIARETPDLIRNNVRLHLTGCIDRLPQEPRELLQKSVDQTAACTGMTLNLAISYSARWEITEAVRSIARQAAQGTLNPDDITDQTVAQAMASPSIPDPDLLIRTGGDLRISNFLLWQLAYSELVFTNRFWPDYSKQDFLDALLEYSHRQRRYGLTGDQVEQNPTTTHTSDNK
jgi:undecaprenyl diphosphate synthase